MREGSPPCEVAPAVDPRADIDSDPSQPAADDLERSLPPEFLPRGGKRRYKPRLLDDDTMAACGFRLIERVIGLAEHELVGR